MSDSYPSLGIKVDFAEIRRLTDALKGVQGEYAKTGKASEDSALKAIAASVRMSNEHRAAMQSRIAIVRQMMGEERQAAENELSFRMRMTKQGAEEVKRAGQSAVAAERAWANQRLSLLREVEAGVRRSEQVYRDQAAQTLAFNMRINKQRVAEAERTAELEAAAARRAAMGGYDGTQNRTFPGARVAGGSGMRVSIAEMMGLGSAMSGVSAIAARFSDAFSGLFNVLHRVRTAVFDVRTAIGLLVGAMVVGPIVRMADAMTALEARTALYASRASDVPYTFAAIYETAQRARAPLESIATLYTRLAPLAERLGKSQSGVLRTVETVAKSFAIGGATSAESTSSAQQLAQALGSNRLGGDELRSLSENAPVLLLKISQALGMNTGEFIKWAHSGKANAKIIVDAIDSAAAEIDEMFKSMPVTISQATTLVSNSITHLIGEVNRATGASASLASAMAGFAGWLEADSTIRAVTASVSFLSSAFGVMGKAIGLVVDYAPTIVTLFAAFAAGAFLPGLLSRISVALLFMGGPAMGGVGIAATRLATAFAALLTPLNIFLVAAVAAAVAVNTLSNASKRADEAFLNYGNRLGQAGNILLRVRDQSEAYGASTKNLDGIIGNLVETIDDKTAADGRTMSVAQQRVEIEKLLAENSLRSAYADATAAAAADARGAAHLRLLANLQLGLGKIPGLGGVADRWSSETFNNAGALQASSDLNATLAAALKKSADDVKDQKWTVTTPGTASGAGGADSAAATAERGMAAARNAIAKMKAEIIGLKAEIDTVSADPLSILAAKIVAAGEAERAARTEGKASQFADEAARLGREREELKIRLGLLQESTKAERQSTEETQKAAITSAAHAAGLQAINSYYAAGVDDANAYAAALDGQTDAQTGAKLAILELSIAQRYGVESIDQIAAAYGGATKASQEAAVALQAQIQKEYDAAAATETGAAANEKATRATERLTASRKAVFDMTVQLALLERSASMTPSEREASADALVYKERLLVEAQAEGVTLGQQFVEKMAAAAAQADLVRKRVAQMKIEMTDAIKKAFVETGKLDFSSIKEGLTRSIRQAVYDALIARPIQIIVDAVVDITTRGLNQIIDKILGAKNQNGDREGGWLKDAMSKLPEGVQKAIEKGMVIAKDAAVGYQIGTTVSDMVGLKGSNKNGGRDQAIVDQAASVVGSAIGGPLGAALAVAIMRVVGPALLGKESNFAALATFGNAGTSFTIGGSKRTKESTEAVTGIAEGVMSVIKTLATMGIQAGEVIKNIDIGTRDPTHIRLNNGMDVRSAVGDPEAALKAASLALIQYGTYQDTRMKALVDQMVAANNNFDAIVAKLDQYVTAQKVPKDLQTALLQFSNPRAAQLRQLQDQQIERRKTIQGYATSGFYTPSQLSEINSNLTALERNEIASVVERFADSLDGAAHSLQDFKDAQEDIAKFTRRLMTGSLSPLSQEDQLSLNRQSFITNLSRASGGDYGAMTGITEDAQAYLTAAQRFFGSTQAYTDIFKEVTDALNVLSSQEIQDPMVSAIEQAAIDLQAALEAQTLAIIAAIQAANNNTVDGLAGVGEAVVTTNGGGLANISDTLVEQTRYSAALNGGMAA